MADALAEGAAADEIGSPRRLTVSVLIPNYNHAMLLPRQLESVCAQTRPADEVLVLDDGSTDHSVQVIRGFAARHPQVRLLLNDRNRGLLYSINRLLREARGDCLVSAAADDMLLPGFLEKSLGALERHPDAGICVSEFVVIETDGRVVNYSREMPASFGLHGLPEYLTARDFRDRFRDGYLWISTNTVVARRAAVLAAGGFLPALKWHADWLAFYSVALRWGLCVVPEGLAAISVNPGGYSDVGMKNWAEQREVLRALVQTLKAPSHRDLLPFVRRRPALLSVFGRELAVALRGQPRHWDLLVPYTLYLGRRYWHTHFPYWLSLLRQRRALVRQWGRQRLRGMLIHVCSRPRLRRALGPPLIRLWPRGAELFRQTIAPGRPDRPESR
jgi:glycosyltransferase involved in cell wall biosynthesis